MKDCINKWIKQNLETDHYQAKHRNSLLAEAFYLTGEVEKYGTGFIRIRKHLIDYPELSYTIQDLNDFLRVVIGSNKDVTKDVTKEKRLEEVLNLVSKNKSISTKDIAKLLDVTMRTIMRDIETLRDKGKLKRIGGRKDGYWKIIDKNEK